MERFLFLDRDGTLIRDTEYPHRIEECELLPGVVPALVRMAAAGFELAIVTNQSGIGRGYFSEDDYQRFQAHLVGVLEVQGLDIAGTFHCPHAPDDGCACRKPEPGLLFRARDEVDADLAESWLVGDSPGDVEAARRAGLRGAVLLTEEEQTGTGDAYQHTAPDLPGAADIILDED